MGTQTSTSSEASDRWSQANDTPAGNGLLVPALVLLAIVIAIELMSLVLVIQGHVAQAQVRERVRATSHVTAAVASLR